MIYIDIHIRIKIQMIQKGCCSSSHPWRLADSNLVSFLFASVFSLPQCWGRTMQIYPANIPPSSES